MNSSDEMSGTTAFDATAVPLPSYGEEDANSGVTAGTPVTLPSFGEPINGNNGISANTPVTLPSFGEPINGGVITPCTNNSCRPFPPIQITPSCLFCGNNNNSFTKVRFLNAAYGYNPFQIMINNRRVASSLGFASLTTYGRIGTGFQSITILGTNGYVYLQMSLPFRMNETMTIAIINTANGIDLLQINDESCATPANYSCLRACNLAYYSRPLDVVLSDGRVVFSDVQFKETTPYRRTRTGEYEFYIAETNLRPMPRDEDIETVGSTINSSYMLPQVLVSFFVTVRPNTSYTMYMLNWSNSPDAIQILTVDNQQ